MGDSLIPPSESGKFGNGDRDQQIADLIKLMATLAGRISTLERRVVNASTANEEDGDTPASWVWFEPPVAAEDDPESSMDPRTTVENFVAWYNTTFVGFEGGRARRIPECWCEHPGLAMEVAVLAYSWHAANVGGDATVRDAQYWLHQWRPGFTDRLLRDWVHADCVDGQHRVGGAPARSDRYTDAASVTAP